MAVVLRIDEQFIDRLLSLPPARREELLVREGLFGEDGLGRLLDRAEEMVERDPDRALKLAGVCVKHARDAEVPAVAPHASYRVVMRVRILRGDYEEALSTGEVAREQYLALGMWAEALRVSVGGRMTVLQHLGRYEEALETGRRVLEELEAGSPRLSGCQRGLIAAIAHQNRGCVLEYTGEFEEALKAYGESERLYRRLGMTDRIGDILTDRGAILAQLGRAREALGNHEAAAEIFEAEGMELARAVALVNSGEAMLRLGLYSRSLRALERARSIMEPLGVAGTSSLLVSIADVYLGLNLYFEALAAYRKAKEALREGGARHDFGRALMGEGSALVGMSRLREAVEALKGAEDIFEQAGNRPMVAATLLERSSLSYAGEDRRDALQRARRALELAEGRHPLQETYARLRLADYSMPDVEAAEEHLAAAGRISESLPLGHLRYRIRHRLGRVAMLRGDLGRAGMLLRSAVDEIERLRSGVLRETLRGSFLRDKVEVYEDLMRLSLELGDEEEAFAVCEQSRSRALVDLLFAKEEGGEWAASEGAESLSDLKAELGVIYERLLGTDGTLSGAEHLKHRALELEEELSASRLRAESSRDTDGTPARSMTAAEIPASLEEGVAMVEYYTSGDEVLAFIIGEGGIAVVRNLCSVHEVKRLTRRLSAEADRLRNGGSLARLHGPSLELSTRRTLHALYRMLFEPLKGELGGARGLVVVPHGVLHRIPFHALHDGEGYLIERMEISYAPSATAYALASGREPRGYRRSLVLGVSDALIPEVETEVDSIARALPGAEVYRGRRATSEALEQGAGGKGVLHLACHGAFRSDSPMFSTLKLGDGWFTAFEASRLELDGALVTLSACDSGRSRVEGGDELLGFTRAFLGAGASTLVVSLAPAQDSTAAGLMSDMYGRIARGDRPAAALRAAQLKVLRNCPHPFCWAPFVLVGRR